MDEAINGDAAGKCRLPPAQRDWALAQCATNVEGFKAFLANQPAINMSDSGLRNRRPASDGVLDADDIAFCSTMGISPEDFKKQREKEAN